MFPHINEYTSYFFKKIVAALIINVILKKKRKKEEKRLEQTCLEQNCLYLL